MVPPPLYCPICGVVNQPQASFCYACGQPLRITSSHPRVFTGALSYHHLLKQRYTIIERIGKGGFGAVYKAKDTLFNNRIVAIKEMRQHSLRPEAVVVATRAFKQEARLLATLSHPSLPCIYDHFFEDGHWYLVMDFIEGETLAEHLQSARGNALPVEEVLAIGIQLCTVLDYLHTRQPPIIFRDLKPTNVMLTENLHVYLIDFGIARHFKPGQSQDTNVVGTEGYAAPEQYGQAQTTPRSDIYSLGVLLHQLLSGCDPTRKPFFFEPLQLCNQPLLCELETLIVQMLSMYENQRPESMAVVKQRLKRIAAQLAAIEVHTKSSRVQAQEERQARVTSQCRHQTLKIPRQSAPASTSPKSVPALGTLLCAYRNHHTMVRVLAWSPDGRYIASACHDDVIHIWSATTGDRISTYRGHTCWISALAWSPDGQYMVSACANKMVRVWKANTGSCVASYRGHSARVTALAWSPDGLRIASASDDCTIHVWEATTGGNIAVCRGHSDSVHAVTWSPGGQRIASASEDQTVQVWDPASGGRVFTYRRHTSWVSGVVWSPDGQSIASASDDQTVQVWNAPLVGVKSSHAGGDIFTYHGHTAGVNALAWSPGGQRLASAGEDQTVQVWNAARHSLGSDVFVYRGHSASVNAIAWSPDGARIASAGSDRTVQVWQAI